MAWFRWITQDSAFPWYAHDDHDQWKREDRKRVVKLLFDARISEYRFTRILGVRSLPLVDYKARSRKLLLGPPFPTQLWSFRIRVNLSWKISRWTNCMIHKLKYPFIYRTNSTYLQMVCLIHTIELVVIYALTSGIAGYTAASFYHQLEGSNWVSYSRCW